MFYYGLLIAWLMSILAIMIAMDKKLDNKILLILCQIYNFIVGLSAWVIFFFVNIFGLMYLGEVEAVLFVFLLLIAIYIVLMYLLLIPLNKKIKRKSNQNTVSYILISSTVFSLGILAFVILGRLNIIV